MLPKNLRISSKKIPIIAKKGKKLSFKFFNIRAWYENDLENSQFAIVVSLKVDKRAVIRNRIKRKLRVCINKIKNESYKKGSFLIIVTSSELKEMDNDEIQVLLLKALQEF